MSQMFTQDAGRALDGRECRLLLGSESIGRVAGSLGALPFVVPVQYRLTGDQVVFDVPGDTLYRALAHNVVAFEVDRVDPFTRQGWMVLVVGRSHPTDVDATATDRNVAGAGGADRDPVVSRTIAVELDRLSGRVGSGLGA